MAEEKEHKIIQDDEIDLVELAKTIWAGRRFIAKVAGVFALIGLIIAFTSPVEYEASSKLLPESQEGQMPNMGGLAGLAGLAGVDLSSMGGAGSGVLTPQLYPEIVNSLPFILEVMNDTVYFEQLDLHTTSFHYFKEVETPTLLGYVMKYTIGLPGTIKKAFSAEEIIKENTSPFYRLSKKDWGIIEKFKERISIEIDAETGILGVTVEMPDPYAAAQIAKKIELMVTEAVIKYKTDKSLENLEFIQGTYEEAKNKFEKIQYKLARATDRNMNVTSATGQIELKNIEQEYEITFDVYKGLSTQVEQAKIQLKEQTPVFTVLEPVRIPEDKSQPKRSIILLLFTFVGFGIGGILCLILKKT
ncbi:Wzz/FepE/Etk N-terminal domain-containing protein [Reichenbachiella carrageenanivorans]|uniref:Wzz/FepE/Etk N-terminal domain-containing protein n=1 Tax=Reichenbachiella carrageenanivorans TaxID=2979869 RepID=A0ABY6D369_9BACT|nr:Wzz/FepE/Etk N-terminal domain-containing protein [Reichenbachiella carrageenanivorans]UXX80609.1 Wzz/FepE/Etk N-terminal domain-containing protein [Reichenbachiella carrageenanivorans]